MDIALRRVWRRFVERCNGNQDNRLFVVQNLIESSINSAMPDVCVFRIYSISLYEHCGFVHTICSRLDCAFERSNFETVRAANNERICAMEGRPTSSSCQLKIRKIGARTRRRADCRKSLGVDCITCSFRQSNPNITAMRMSCIEVL
jgi:hypothetical protein